MNTKNIENGSKTKHNVILKNPTETIIFNNQAEKQQKEINIDYSKPAKNTKTKAKKNNLLARI
jgi:hypothetical protein